MVLIEMDKLQAFIQGRFDGAEVRVSDMTGTGDHMEVQVVSSKFEGMNRLERHRLLHQIVREAPAADDIHAVKFVTYTPGEFTSRSSS